LLKQEVWVIDYYLTPVVAKVWDRVINCVCHCEGLSVCPCSKRKISQSINTKLGTHAVHGSPSSAKNET